MWDLIIWLVFGALVGIVSSYFTGSKRGLLGNIIVGIIGSFLAGWAASGFGSFTSTTVSWSGFFLSILGSIVFVALLNLLVKKR